MTMRRCSFIPLLLLLASCSEAPPPSDERPLTAGLGYAASPALSRDRSMVAFSAGPADRSTSQIWIRRTDLSAPAVQLTSDESKNYDPEFSPDGASIYFTSSRSPEGIYRIAASGGAAELVIPGGVSAKISPDGNRLVYGGGMLYQRPVEGGPATPLLPAVDSSWGPVWSPDGSRILMTARNGELEPEWWITGAAGGEPVKSSIPQSLREQGFNAFFAHA